MPDPAAVNTMFGRIARRYDVANRLLSGGIDRRWRKKLVRAVQQSNPESVLDLATGSGDVAFSLGEALPETVSIVGMDFCEPMLEQAEVKKKHHAGRASRITFRVGDALALPVESQSIDALTIAFGLRNLADRHRGLTEMRRVLRPGGHLFVLEFSQPYRWFRPLYYFYLRRLLPGIAGVVTGDRAAYEYLNATIGQFPDRTALAEEIRLAGYADVTATPLSLGIVALHVARA